SMQLSIVAGVLQGGAVAAGGGGGEDPLPHNQLTAVLDLLLRRPRRGEWKDWCGAWWFKRQRLIEMTSEHTNTLFHEE
ncbi:hypothetical protein AAY51_23880, partial [Vibrio parahaemolyticus]